MKSLSNSLFLLLTTLFFLSLSAIGADELWDKAVGQMNLDNIVIPTSMRIEGHVENRNGETTKRSVMEYIRDEETDEIILVSAIENGKDITEKQRRRITRQQNRNREPFIHPLANPGEAEGLSLYPQDYMALIHGRECKVYRFRLEYEMKMGPGGPKSMVEEGRLFLDSETGMPLIVESSLIEGPRMIRSASYQLHARTGPEGRMRLEKAGLEFVGQVMAYRAGGFDMVFGYSEQ